MNFIFNRIKWFKEDFKRKKHLIIEKEKIVNGANTIHLYHGSIQSLKAFRNFLFVNTTMLQEQPRINVSCVFKKTIALANIMHKHKIIKNEHKKQLDRNEKEYIEKDYKEINNKNDTTEKLDENGSKFHFDKEEEVMEDKKVYQFEILYESNHAPIHKVSCFVFIVIERWRRNFLQAKIFRFFLFY